MSIPDKIEAAIVDVISRVGADAVARKKHDAAAKGTDWRDETWHSAQATNEILSALFDLAHQENYQAAASKELGSATIRVSPFGDMSARSGRVSGRNAEKGSEPTTPGAIFALQPTRRCSTR
jgi:hypothetical protein